MSTPDAYGLLFPFQRDGRGDFAKGEIAELVRGAIQQVLGVRGAGPSTQGELPWRTAYGSQVYRLQHANNDAALEDIVRFFVLDAIANYEPRIQLTDVRVSRESVSGFGERAALRVSASYTIRRSAVSTPVETVEVVL
jgi:phage baseplate assembly protein W